MITVGQRFKVAEDSQDYDFEVTRVYLGAFGSVCDLQSNTGWGVVEVGLGVVEEFLRLPFNAKFRKKITLTKRFI